jgi:hypothetical protein
VVSADGPGGYSVDAPPSTPRPQGLFFGGVRTGRAYASFHFFPVCTHPDLLEGVSPELRKRMQGKSCFNFRRLDPDQRWVLQRLVWAGLERYRREGRLG